MATPKPTPDAKTDAGAKASADNFESLAGYPLLRQHEPTALGVLLFGICRCGGEDETVTETLTSDVEGMRRLEATGLCRIIDREVHDSQVCYDYAATLAPLLLPRRLRPGGMSDWERGIRAAAAELLGTLSGAKTAVAALVDAGLLHPPLHGYEPTRLGAALFEVARTCARRCTLDDQLAKDTESLDRLRAMGLYGFREPECLMTGRPAWACGDAGIGYAAALAPLLLPVAPVGGTVDRGDDGAWRKTLAGAVRPDITPAELLRLGLIRRAQK